MRLLLLLPMCALIQACATGKEIDYIDTSCARFKPITWSSRDTDETLRQVAAHNIVFDSACSKKTAPTDIGKVP